MSSIPHTHTHTTEHEDLVQIALNDYMTSKYLNIEQTAQKYRVSVSDIRKAFAKHLEEKYCK